MTITLQAVNELIASLESAGELSIRETKVMALAKAYVQLAAETLQIKAMNDCLSEELRGYESDGAFEGPKMHLLWWQVETPATDRIVAEAEARGVEKFAAHLRANDSGASVCKMIALGADDFAKQLREGGRQMSKSFIVIIRRAWCNEGGHGIEYSSDLIHYETRNGAISHGFRTVDSDDFNVGVIEDGKLISFDWMDKPVGESEDTLAQIAELIGLEDAA